MSQSPYWNIDRTIASKSSPVVCSGGGGAPAAVLGSPAPAGWPSPPAPRAPRGGGPGAGVPASPPPAGGPRPPAAGALRVGGGAVVACVAWGGSRPEPEPEPDWISTPHPASAVASAAATAAMPGGRAIRCVVMAVSLRAADGPEGLPPGASSPAVLAGATLAGATWQGYRPRVAGWGHRLPGVERAGTGGALPHRRLCPRRGRGSRPRASGRRRRGPARSARNATPRTWRRPLAHRSRRQR